MQHRTCHHHLVCLDQVLSGESAIATLLNPVQNANPDNDFDLSKVRVSLYVDCVYGIYRFLLKNQPVYMLLKLSQ
jgi:Fe2+ or Zn2+ uptake regulation protein